MSTLTRAILTILLFVVVVAAANTRCEAAYIKGGNLHHLPGEKQDQAQSNEYVTVINRSDGSVQVFYHDPDANNKLVQKEIPAGQSLKICYWNSAGQRMLQEVKTPKYIASKGSLPTSPVAQIAPASTSSGNGASTALTTSASTSSSYGSTPVPSSAGSFTRDSVAFLPPTPESGKQVVSSPTRVTESSAESVATSGSGGYANTGSIARAREREAILPGYSPDAELPASPIQQASSASSAASALSPIDNVPSSDTENSTKDSSHISTAGSRATGQSTANPPISAHPSESTGVPLTAADILAASGTALDTMSVLDASASVTASGKAPSYLSGPMIIPTTGFSGGAIEDSAAPVVAQGLQPAASFGAVPPVTKPVIQKVPTTGDSFISATNTSLGPCAWKKFPIRVFMSAASAANGGRLQEEVRDAFETWTRVTGNKIRFEFVGNKEQADIVVSWVNTHVGLLNPNEAGEASVDYHTTGKAKKTLQDPGDITRARIKLVTRNLNGEWQPGELRLVALHEIGHSLGIFGHSSNPGDIMYSAKGAKELSARDINTVNILYASVSGQ